jgi:hypothetical protein
MRPGADQKFGLCGPQLSFELGKSVHVKKFSTVNCYVESFFNIIPDAVPGSITIQPFS